MRITRQKSSSGFALIMVMCVIIVLTAIVAGFVVSMKTEMTLARNADYDNELEWMGRSGVELARYQLANKCPEMRGIDSLNQPWAGGTSPCSNDVESVPFHWDSGRGSFSIKMVDMERKWDINIVATAPGGAEILQRALQEVGVTDSEKASTIADSIVDWVSPSSSQHFSGAESDYYLSLDPPYTCKNGPIDDLSELLLVKGMTPEIYWGSFSTNHPESAYHQSGGATSDTAPKFRDDHQDVYPIGLHELFSAMGGPLNINTASAKTLALIPGVDEAGAERIVQGRAGGDGQDGTEDDTPYGPRELPQEVANLPPALRVGVISTIFEVHVDAQINGYKRSFVGVISKSGPTGQSKCVRFYWEN